MSDLYEHDILSWSEHQVDLLRRHAAGERLNTEMPDWTNIIEEIESVGREQLHAVESLLLQALLHQLKIAAWPESHLIAHWQSEVTVFLANARRRYVASMRRRIDLEGIYQDALRALPADIEGQPPLPVSTACPVTLEALLAG